MAGLDRVIDSNTGDYVRDDATGAVTKTSNASTAIHHQVKGIRGQWWGDPDAGSRLIELERAKSLLRTPQVIADILTQALQRLIDDGRITAPTFEQQRMIDRIDTSITVEDLQSGETLQLRDLLPFVP